VPRNIYLRHALTMAPVCAHDLVSQIKVRFSYAVQLCHPRM